MTSLAGRRALVIGIANDRSIAYGCARAMRAEGVELALTYLNGKAEPHVRPLAEDVGAALCFPLDVREAGAIEGAAALVEEAWGGLDILVHSIAFAPREDLHGRLVDTSREGFLEAMDISVHSFVRLAKAFEPMLEASAAAGRTPALVTMSYQGAERVVDNYGLMGPVKAALETAARYMAAELGPKGIRVHVVSPGPIATRAASGIGGFDALMARSAERAPARRLVTIEEVGAVAAFLASPGASGMTGNITFVDAGEHVVGVHLAPTLPTAT